MSSMIEYKVLIDNFRILNIDDEIISNEEIYYFKEVLVNEEKVSVNILLRRAEKESNIFILKLISEKELFENEFMIIAEKISKDLLNKIAFYCIGVKVGDPLIIETHFKDINMKTDEIKCSMTIDTEDKDKKILKTLCKEIKKDKDFDGDTYSLFRSAMNNEDVVIRYMFLYQILSNKHRNENGLESQKSVDEFIKSQISEDKHMYQKWIDTEREETIYTRLRNQVGHFRGKTPCETRSVMDIKINDLVELVKKSIN